MTPQEPSVADRLRDALTAAATVQRARHLDLPEAVLPSRKHVTRTWLVPAAAAVCVVAIALGALAIVGGHKHTDSNDALSGLPSEVATLGMPPAYFVVPGHTGGLQVRRTSNGALTDWFWPSSLGKSWMPDVISVASDNRMFFATAYVSPTMSRFFRFTITDSGKIAGFQSVGVPITGFPEDFAVSPDGSRVAYTLRGGKGHGETVNIMNLTSGTTRTWHNTVTEQTTARVQYVFDMSWLPDGRTLVVDYEWIQYLYLSNNLAAVALDTTSTGGSLQAHSRRLWSQDGRCTLCLRDLLAGPDGKSLTALVVQNAGGTYTEAVVRMSLATRRPVSILYRASGRPLPIGEEYPALAADGTGRYLALFTGWQSSHLLTSAPGQAGWISGGRLVPLRVPEPVTFLVFAW